MKGALSRYRVMAYVVGIGLLVLVLVAMPLKYFADAPLLVQIVGPVHGLLYAIYLALTIDLALKSRWSIKGTILVALAGTIPFVSFYAERKVTERAREGVAL
ncbi:DUF3817 domain-containing protein [Solihabitans fulvus]|uniref:DUF3817 domain-containing protein n=1 Tax=Solihabitans fulvus TaxID=1892852 RepID=A0A5B2X6F1_9PSEU|nr:DUF3817 domain-containing protein [Solihabitans fulvus]KAA2258824.1 DUF3817 domain-containing protein [Solihabitans fulvus]